MNWLLATYLLLFVAMSVAGIFSDLNSSRARWLVSAGIATLALGSLCVFAFALPEVRNFLGRSLWLAIAFGLAAEIGLAVSDVAEMRDEMTLRKLAATMAITAIVAVPAYVLGALAAARQ